MSCTMFQSAQQELTATSLGLRYGFLPLCHLTIILRLDYTVTLRFSDRKLRKLTEEIVAIQDL